MFSFLIIVLIKTLSYKKLVSNYSNQLKSLEYNWKEKANAIQKINFYSKIKYYYS